MIKAVSFLWSCSLLLLISCHNNNQPVPAKSDPLTVTPKISPVDNKVKTILFFGNSLTAGYGLDPSEAFPALIEARIDSMKLPYKVINAGLSGETSAGGKSRIAWILRQPVDIFILELGANDGLRGISALETSKNLQSIIDEVRIKYPVVKIVLAGMKIPPSMGNTYASEFSGIYPKLTKRNKLSLIPFLLEGVGGETQLNQKDEIHPTAEGDKIIAENVWKVLKKLL